MTKPDGSPEQLRVCFNSGGLQHSEFELIDLIAGAVENRAANVATWIGDDAAVVNTAAVSVISVDTFVDRVHFDRRNATPRSIGCKAMAGALSDLAAMGAHPGEVFVCLGLPKELESDELLQLYEGMEHVASSSGVTVCGGDLTRASELFVSIAAVGWVDSEDDAVRRSGARAGDRVGVTGQLGGAGAGLALLRGIEVSLPRGMRQELIERQQRPLPRVELGLALAGAGASAMIDLSDGVAADALRIAEASKATIDVMLPKLPLQAGVAEVAAALQTAPAALAASAGEDYELLVTVAPDACPAAEKAVSDAGGCLTWIGEVRSSGQIGLELLDAESNPVQLTGFDHFA